MLITLLDQDRVDPVRTLVGKPPFEGKISLRKKNTTCDESLSCELIRDSTLLVVMSFV